MRRHVVAEYAGVDESTVDRHRRAGRLLPVGRLGGIGEWTYTRIEVDRWLSGLGFTSERAESIKFAVPAKSGTSSQKVSDALTRLMMVRRGVVR